MNARCQVCGATTYRWTVNRADINVGALQNYTIQACETCAKALESAIVRVLTDRKA